MRQVSKDILTIENGIILHAVGNYNNLDGGLSFQIANRYPEVMEVYTSYFKEYEGSLVDLLGDIILVPVTNTLFVANLICISLRGSTKVLEYTALKLALKELAHSAIYSAVSQAGEGVYVPYKMGSGANSAEWSIISNLIEREIPNSSVCVLQAANTKRK